MRKILLFTFMLSIALSISAQNKKVAVVTFYANKFIEADESLAGGAALVAAISAIAKDDNFNLKPTLDKFHKTFFENFSKEFPFDFIDENTVLNNEEYKNYVRRDTSYTFLNNSLSMEGYNLYDVGVMYKQDLDKMASIFPDVDGFMFIFMSFKIAPKVSVGGMGTAGVQANITMKLWNKEGKKVFNIYESAMSKKTVALIGGVPVMKTVEILPACETAADILLEDLLERMPKIVKKVGAKL
jgi:hypothetical protein